MRNPVTGILCLGRSAGLPADTDTDILLGIAAAGRITTPRSHALEASYRFDVPGEGQEIECGERVEA
jgi:hypothetical protein